MFAEYRLNSREPDSNSAWLSGSRLFSPSSISSKAPAPWRTVSGSFCCSTARDRLSGKLPLVREARLVQLQSSTRASSHASSTVRGRA